MKRPEAPSRVEAWTGPFMTGRLGQSPSPETRMALLEVGIRMEKIGKQCHGRLWQTPCRQPALGPSFPSSSSGNSVRLKGAAEDPAKVALSVCQWTS